MGIFYEQAPCKNRTPVDLTVTFDGQCKTLPAGKVTSIPKKAILYAKNQNPVMGSQDPNNPNFLAAKYLVSDLSEDDTSDNEHEAMTEEEWNDHLGQPQRINAQEAFEEKYGSDPKAKLVTLGKGRKSTAKGKSEVGGNPRFTKNEIDFQNEPQTS